MCNFNYYYQLDLDTNEIPRFTEKNIALIEAILKIDSNYRADFSPNGGTYIQSLKNNGFPTTRNELLYIMKSMDKMNSTHAHVGNSIDRMADYLCGKIGLQDASDKICNGDLDIVTEIAKANPNRFNISFASKFCAYCSQICFNGNVYSKYDKVVANVLPYYTFKYLKDNTQARTKRTGAKESLTIVDRNSTYQYKNFVELIGSVIDAINKEEKITVSRQQFDWLVWYYFKGDDTRQQEALKKII